MKFDDQKSKLETKTNREMELLQSTTNGSSQRSAGCGSFELNQR